MYIVNDSRMELGFVVGRVPPHELSVTVVVKGTFRLVSDTPATLEAKQLPVTADEAANDLVWFKPRTDLLLSGKAYAPEGRATPQLTAGFQVGGWTKELAVIGNRAWKEGFIGAKMSDPVPFREMPLSWATAYGGAGYPLNPLGRGFVKDPSTGEWPLPNVEFIDRLITSHRQKPEPAGFGPIPFTWPQRREKSGTFKGKWVQEHWPWLPPDFDWTYFNCAPADQQLPDWLRGDETIVLHHLRPDRPRLASRLPGLRPRWFIRDTAGFRDVKLVLDTLSVDAEKELVTLLWRGNSAIRSKKMREISEFFVVSESFDSSARPLEHYDRLLAQRRKEIAGEAEAPPLPAAAPIPGIPDKLPEGEKRLQEMHQEFAKEKDRLAKELQEIEKIKKDAAASFGKAGAPPPNFGRAVPNPDAAMASAYLGFLARLNPEFPPHAQVPPPPPQELNPPPEPPPPEESPDEEEPEEEEDEEDRPWTRERCIEHAKRGGVFDGLELEGLDLSGLDFSARSFRDAVLEGANLTGARFSRADLSGAVLAGAKAGGADFRSARLPGASLGGALLAEARFDEALLEDAELAEAKLAGASFVGTHAERADFTRADLTGASAADGNFQEANFTGARLAGADFRRTVLAGACVDECTGPGVRMSEADLSQIQVGSSADFSKGDFTKIRGWKSTWQQAILTDANFSGAALERADFTAASLQRAAFVRAGLKHAVFDEANLEQAQFVKANLFRASFADAKALRASFVGANLYEAEFWGAVLDGADFRTANLKGTKIADRS